jgi:hypothetical protein
VRMSANADDGRWAVGTNVGPVFLKGVVLLSVAIHVSDVGEQQKDYK